MYRFSFMTTILLATLLTFSGCASKTAGNGSSVPPEPASAEAGIATAAANSIGVQSESVAAPSSATLSTLGGKQLETVYFDYDSFTLKPATRAALERNAAWLKANSSIKVTIEGHCDERGSDEYNLALGERRAIAVKNYLTALGIGDERIATISYGEERPAVAGNDEAAWTKNRRGDFR